ncbi:MAG: thermonuclease family protein [Alphaproteobacteria bacterium]|nr:MAG: thermonuclease family protein [Alphaproteobacteria bacterium]
MLVVAALVSAVGWWVVPGAAPRGPGPVVSAADRTAPDTAPGPVLSGRARVIDGDTLKIGRWRIRLHAIDAPERGQSCIHDARRIDCGALSAAMLGRLIGGADLACAVRTTDRYRRLVAVCRRDGRDIARLMVRGGWARAYLRYGDDYAADEAHARRNRLGLWAGGEGLPAPWVWRRRQAAIAAPDRS